MKGNTEKDNGKNRKSKKENRRLSKNRTLQEQLGDKLSKRQTLQKRCPSRLHYIPNSIYNRDK
jgi:hypothetical protein